VDGGQFKSHGLAQNTALITRTLKHTRLIGECNKKVPNAMLLDLRIWPLLLFESMEPTRRHVFGRTHGSRIPLSRPEIDLKKRKIQKT